MPKRCAAFERFVILNAVDRLWQEHLYAMDGLREAVYLRAFAQKDPLVEYKNEAFAMFGELMDNIKLEVLNNLFGAQPTCRPSKLCFAVCRRISSRQIFPGSPLRPEPVAATLSLLLLRSRRTIRSRTSRRLSFPLDGSFPRSAAMNHVRAAAGRSLKLRTNRLMFPVAARHSTMDKVFNRYDNTLKFS